MDLKDVQILLELQRNPFASHEAIGRGVRIGGPAVRDRLERMTAAGVLLGFQIAPLPQSLHRHWHLFVFPQVGDRLEVREVLRCRDVIAVNRHANGDWMVNTYDRNERPDPGPDLRKRMGRRPVGAITLDAPTTGAPAEAELSSLDWRVMDALVDSPRAPLNEVAGRAGIAPRTVRKRRARLLAKQLMMVLPIIDTRREPGLIVYGGYVGVRRLEDIDAISIPGLSFYRRLYRPPAAWFMGHSATLSELQRTERDLRAAPGVEAVDISPASPADFATARLHTWIRAEIRHWARFRSDRGAPPPPRRPRRIRTTA